MFSLLSNQLRSPIGSLLGNHLVDPHLHQASQHANQPGEEARFHLCTTFLKLAYNHVTDQHPNQPKSQFRNRLHSQRISHPFSRREDPHRLLDSRRSVRPSSTAPAITRKFTSIAFGKSRRLSSTYATRPTFTRLQTVMNIT